MDAVHLLWPTLATLVARGLRRESVRFEKKGDERLVLTS